MLYARMLCYVYINAIVQSHKQGYIEAKAALNISGHTEGFVIFIYVKVDMSKIRPENLIP